MMEALLVAKLPLPAQIPESAAPQISGRRNDAAHATETMNFPLTTRVVRHAPEGIGVEFVSGSKSQLQALEGFLLAVREGKRIAEGKATKAGAAQPTNENVVPAAPQHYLWWFPGCPVKVHLALDVVQRLNERLRCTQAVASDEGLLFGKAADGTTEILDLQPATDTNVPGMVAGLRAERKGSLVGYYRTEKGEAFHLNARDLSLATECFAKPYNVFLMVHCNTFGPPTATLFFQDRDCRMAEFAFLEFPFDSSLLAAEQCQRMQRSEQAVEKSADVSLPVTPPSALPEAIAEVPHSKRRFVFKPVRWPLGAVFAIGILLGSYIWRAISHPSSSKATSFSSAPTAPFVTQPSISLRASRRNGNLELTWNRDSAAIAAATSGTLSIQDGGSRRLILLDVKQLGDGRFLYAPMTDQVLIQLTVTTPAKDITESVTAILPKAGGSSSRAGETPEDPSKK
jgi:hypothetical protein